MEALEVNGTQEVTPLLPQTESAVDPPPPKKIVSLPLPALLCFPCLLPLILMR